MAKTVSLNKVEGIMMRIKFAPSYNIPADPVDPENPDQTVTVHKQIELQIAGQAVGANNVKQGVSTTTMIGVERADPYTNEEVYQYIDAADKMNKGVAAALKAWYQLAINVDLDAA